MAEDAATSLQRHVKRHPSIGRDDGVGPEGVHVPGPNHRAKFVALGQLEHEEHEPARRGDENVGNGQEDQVHRAFAHAAFLPGFCLGPEDAIEQET